MHTRQGLLKLKTRALRKGVWFKALSKIERSIVDLTIRCVEKVRSYILSRIVANIIDKILKPLENKFIKNAAKVGRKIVENLSKIAERWGNRNALVWKRDPVFIRFLGVNTVNC